MMPRVRRGSSNDRTVLWLACALVLCAAYYIGIYQIGAAIDTQHDLAGQVGSIVRANQATLGERPQLERAAQRIDATLRQFDLSADHATTVARLIRETARVAASHHVRLEAIDERRITAGDQRTAPRTGADPDFEAIPLDVTLTGTYRDLVASIRDLAQAPLVIHLEVASIERSIADDSTERGARLTARLHATVERLSATTPAAPPSATDPPEKLHA